MTPQLQALTTQLNWQKNEVMNQLASIEKEHQALRHEITELEQQLEQNYSRGLVINPELEINRLHFLTHLQEKKLQLQSISNEQQEIISNLGQQIKKIKTELKRLELYLTCQKHEQRLEQRKEEEQAVEEWIIQRRESA